MFILSTEKYRRLSLASNISSLVVYLMKVILEHNE